MKKFSALLLFGIFIFIWTGCKQKSESSPTVLPTHSNTNTPTVTASAVPTYKPTNSPTATETATATTDLAATAPFESTLAAEAQLVKVENLLIGSIFLLIQVL